MLTTDRVSELMHEHKKLEGDFVRDDSITFEQAYERCRKYISRNTKKSYALKADVDAKKESERLIDNFVTTMKEVVDGYGDEGGLSRLRKDLKDEIINYKAITELMEDDTVDEIRINNHKTIFYEQRGQVKPWHKQFNNKEELEKVLSKLITDNNKRLSISTPFVNSRTPEGWRINATDKSISPFNDYTAVIRKFRKKDDKLGLTDIIEGRTLSDNMGNLLRLLPKARFSFLTVGGTGSGKTVTNEIILNAIRPMDRQVYIENPVELTPGIELTKVEVKSNERLKNKIEGLNKLGYVRWFTFTRTSDSGELRGVLTIYTGKDDVGKVVKEIQKTDGELANTITIEEDTGVFANDFIQFQANSDKKEPSSTDPTPNNLVENALRQTPVWIVLGETRSDEEFQVLLKAAQTGHKVVTTYHAEDPEDAIRRYLMAYMAVASNVPAELVLQNICQAFRFIINVKKLMDGTRRVMAITEIIGSEGLKPKLNNIYEFKIDRVDEHGKIIGRHQRVGKISRRSINQFREMGIPDVHYEIYTQNPTEDEVETYLGVK